MAAPLWKGKGRTASDFNDLDPVITYRHLHSHNLGVKDPLRVIALCDSDAFYAACERERLGLSGDAPLVVQQWDSLIAVSYPARPFGISRMDKISEAKKKCPDLVAVHVATFKEGEKEPGYWENPDTRTHKVSLDFYRRESAKVVTLFKEGLPDGEIEKASIDEAFIDFTRPVREEILKRYPYLGTVPVDAPDGPETPLPPPPPILWEVRSTLVPINPTASDATGEAEEEEEQYEEDMDELTTWHDVALSIAAEMMDKVRANVRRQLGYTTSAGLARNKFLAKLAASYRKPNNQTILRNFAIPAYLRPMQFQKIRFLGGKLGKALAEEYDVSTVGDLLSINLEEMQRKFGAESIWVYEILRGIDRTEVKEKTAITKSMLASKNLKEPVTKPSEGFHWVRVLAAELALRLREGREVTPGLWPKAIVLHVRQGYGIFRSKQAVFPFHRDPTVDVIASAGDKLWKELIGGNDAKAAAPLKITNVQLSFTGLEATAVDQRRIEGFFRSPETTTVQPRPELKRKRSSTPTLPAQSSSPAEELPELTTFVCPRCSKKLSLPQELLEAASDEDLRSDAITALKLEHDDFHVAQDLARSEGRRITVSDERSSSKPSSNSGASKKSKKGKTPSSGGIAKFFAQSSSKPPKR